MNWKKTCTLLLVLVFTASLAAGCGGTPAGKTEIKPLRIANGAEPETLDPRKSVGNPESVIQSQIFEGLCTKDQKGEVVPGTAERWGRIGGRPDL